MYEPTKTDITAVDYLGLLDLMEPVILVTAEGDEEEVTIEREYTEQ